MVVTRLGRATDRTGTLDPNGVARTLEVLAEYRDLIEAHGARRMRAVATQAVREAADGADFTSRGAEVLGSPIEVIDGVEEGRYGFLGATSELDESLAPFLVVDIGGGSTELVDRHGRVRRGCLDPGRQRPPDRAAAAIRPARARGAEQRLRARRRAPRRRAARAARGDRGSRRSSASAAPSPRSPRSRSASRSTTAMRCTASCSPGLPPRTCSARSRPSASPTACTTPACHAIEADIIVGGCCVLLAVMRRLELKECVVSETDLLDGIADELAATAAPPAASSPPPG